MNNPALIARANEPTQGQVSRCYSVYGLRIRTTIPLTIPELPGESSYDIDVLDGDPLFFEESLRNLTLEFRLGPSTSTSWTMALCAPRGNVRLLVSPDGSQVLYRPFGEFSAASFETYLLGL